jgi:hypothetical protein
MSVIQKDLGNISKVLEVSREAQNGLDKRERKKIQSPQISKKLTPSRRACRKLSNGVNGSSNGGTNQKIFTVKVLVKLAQSAGVGQHIYY